MAAHPDARIPCPLCGGAIHPIAGRCKHCKGDVGALRGGRPTAAATLPALIARSAEATYGQAATPVPGAPAVADSASPATPEGMPILPARPTGRMHAVAPSARWPAIVIVLSVVSIAIAVTVMLWPAASRPAAAPQQAHVEPEHAGDDVPSDDVRPPVASDLADYTDHLPSYGRLRATIDTSMGTIRCFLYADKAPITVANFVGLATGKKPWRSPDGKIHRGTPFYDGLIFHRVIEDFMIQGGDPMGTGKGGPGYKFADEIHPDTVMEAGTLAMANTGPDTNGSQFFISESGSASLAGRYTIFGKCSDLHVIRRIARAPQEPSSDKPATSITMTVTISR